MNDKTVKSIVAAYNHHVGEYHAWIAKAEGYNRLPWWIKIFKKDPTRNTAPPTVPLPLSDLLKKRAEELGLEIEFI